MRLIDLHVDWLLQYAGESVVLDGAHYPGVKSRVGQAEGYLQATRAAVVSCYRRAEDWASQADPWAALGQLVTRIEAEFPGRVLRDPDDHARWLEDPHGLAWALIGVEGFDPLIRDEADLARLPRLFERGVRLFQPTYTAAGLLAGSSAPGDDRGLTDLGRGFLDALLALAPEGSGPRPIVDLAHLNPTAASDVLGWFEAESARASRLLLAYSHGAPSREGYDAPRALSPGNLARLRALGGVVGVGVTPPFFDSPHQIQAAIEGIAAVPFRGRAGFEGIAIGTDFLGVESTLRGLGNAEEVVAWVQASFDRPAARALLHDNAGDLIARAVGAVRPS